MRNMGTSCNALVSTTLSMPISARSTAMSFSEELRIDCLKGGVNGSKSFTSFGLRMISTLWHMSLVMEKVRAFLFGNGALWKDACLA